jgi:hypothetical protein
LPRHTFRTWDDLPSPARVLGSLFAALTGLVLLRAFFSIGDMPMLLPLVTAFVSIATLLGVGAGREPCQSFMRVGFHLGTFAFFLIFPLMQPADVGPSVSSDVKTVVGWVLLLSIVGFEAAYWGSRVTAGGPPPRQTAFVLTRQHHRVLGALVVFGVIAWFITIVDTAVSGGVSIVDVLLTMRAAVEGADTGRATFFSGPLVIVQRVLDGGVVLAATSASVLLTANVRRSAFRTLICWSMLLMCVAWGFLSGSRAVFFYAVCPVIATSWLKLAQSRVQKSVRWMWIGMAALVIVTSWGAMTALRGADIRKYERGWEAMVPTIHAKGTLDIYSDMAVVIQAFPTLIAYQKGASLIPLALGWVPRAVWPEKPYPFTLFMNFLNGETLENRTMSIAVGLPGEGYGNFGLFGVFLWVVLMGIACRRGDEPSRRRLHRHLPPGASAAPAARRHDRRLGGPDRARWRAGDVLYGRDPDAVPVASGAAPREGRGAARASVRARAAAAALRAPIPAASPRPPLRLTCTSCTSSRTWTCARGGRRAAWRSSSRRWRRRASARRSRAGRPPERTRWISGTFLSRSRCRRPLRGGPWHSRSPRRTSCTFTGCGTAPSRWRPTSAAARASRTS